MRFKSKTPLQALLWIEELSEPHNRIKSTLLYLVSINDLLKGFKVIGTRNIGRVRSCTPCLADDITWFSTIPYGLQTLSIPVQMEIADQLREICYTYL